MLKLLSWMIKFAIFTLVVLVLGNWFQYKGKSVSDQVKTGMALAEHSTVYKGVRSWAKQITGNSSQTQQKTKLTPKQPQSTQDEDLPASERQKLKALIHELNGSNR